MIISLILIAFSLDCVLTLLGENIVVGPTLLEHKGLGMNEFVLYALLFVIVSAYMYNIFYTVFWSQQRKEIDNQPRLNQN